MTTLQLICLPEYARVNWGFRFSEKIKAMAAGPVSEQGMSWWRNTVEQARNAPHVVPADYLIHGTFQRVYVDDIIDYQDFFVFPMANGGSARLSIAGSLRLTL